MNSYLCALLIPLLLSCNLDKKTNVDQSYYIQVEAFNEKGISERSEVLFVE